MKTQPSKTVLESPIVEDCQRRWSRCNMQETERMRRHKSTDQSTSNLIKSHLGGYEMGWLTAGACKSWMLLVVATAG